MNAQDILQRLVQVMDRRHVPQPWVPPHRTWEESYSGGDCDRHGRYYGQCYSCRNEQDKHYDDQREEFAYARRRELEQLADEARALLKSVGG